MNIVIRVDSSLELGTGHVLRCLTLANALKKRGATISFICRYLPSNLINFIADKGYRVWTLQFPEDSYGVKRYSSNKPSLEGVWELDALQTIEIIQKLKPVDYLIIDHYAIDINWEKEVKKMVGKIVVIDDLANRPHDCHILIDANLSDNPNRYDLLVPRNCELFLGTSYAILRDEFREIQSVGDIRDGEIKNLLVFFGGSDPTMETIKALHALRHSLFSEIEINIVVGKSNPQRTLIKEVCNRTPNFTYFCQIDNMAELMRKADLSIGAGGTSTWERCLLGLPTIVIVTAENQFEITKMVSRKGAIRFLGLSEEINDSMIVEAIKDLLNNPQEVRKMSESAKLIMGEDRFDQVIDLIMEE